MVNSEEDYRVSRLLITAERVEAAGAWLTVKGGDETLTLIGCARSNEGLIGCESLRLKGVSTVVL